ncbi:hypothetical protein CVU37_05615 [candidate division BRC1 bacterium HGW-BRC1-1]|nr:MAG: hypothetical protein CVU37_05615 [candidate division BRC1 bacterium HGW-BRC1-1]
MEMLTKDAYEASVRFLRSQGRSLENARYDYAFSSVDPEVVLEALANYQNADGGFGRALEPDLRAPESSALCTTIAFHLFREIGVTADHPLVSSGVEFFLNTFDEVHQSWRIIPVQAAKSPSAPWWYQAERMESLEEFSLNPTAEILGYLFDSQQHVPEKMITLVSNRVLTEILSLEKIEMHELMCCLRLIRTASLPVGFRQQVEGRLRELIGGTVACDPEDWKGYSLRPLQVADTPDSTFIQGFEQAVAMNLDYEITTQNPDGSWTPTWSWDDSYPDEWSRAKKEWAGFITLEKLLILKRFCRIDGLAFSRHKVP